MNDLQSEINRLSNLKQNKKKDIKTIEKMAQFSIWKKQIKIEKLFQQKEDKKSAEEALDSYIQNYEISSYNDMQNLSSLVYEEIQLTKIQQQIDKITSDENNKFVPDKMISILHDIENRIWALKDKIGISSDKKKDDLTALQELQEKMELYIPFHRNEFTTVCGKCGTPLLLRRRCGKEKWENLKHPFFSGRFWYNRRGIELVKAGIWTKEQYAWTFYTSVSYVDWCLVNEKNIVEIDDIEQEEIEKFIQNNDFLKQSFVPAKIVEENKNELKK